MTLQELLYLAWLRVRYPHSWVVVYLLTNTPEKEQLRRTIANEVRPRNGRA